MEPAVLTNSDKYRKLALKAASGTNTQVEKFFMFPLMTGKRLASPEMVLKSVRSNMMTKTQDQVIMRARTRIQASGELKVEYRSSENVFFDPLEDGDAASPFLASTTMVVVEERADEQRWIKVLNVGFKVRLLVLFQAPISSSDVKDSFNLRSGC